MNLEQLESKLNFLKERRRIVSERMLSEDKNISNCSEVDKTIYHNINTQIRELLILSRDSGFYYQLTGAEN